MQLPVGFGLKIYSAFLTTYSPFSGEAHFLSLLVLKDLQPRRAEKSKEASVLVFSKKKNWASQFQKEKEYQLGSSCA